MVRVALSAVQKGCEMRELSPEELGQVYGGTTPSGGGFGPGEICNDYIFVECTFDEYGGFVCEERTERRCFRESPELN